MFPRNASHYIIKNFMDKPIHTRRLTIRYIQESDWTSIQSTWDHVNATPYAQYDRPHSTDSTDVRTRIARWANLGKGPEHFFFAICLHDTVIGYVAFNRRADSFEIGYCFDPAFHGKGYATESLTALMEHMKAQGAEKLSAGTALLNTPSVRLLNTLGFVLVRTEPVSFYADSFGNPIFFEGGIYELVM